MNTILIVDDSATSRMVLRVYLQAIGQTRVFDAADYKQALKVARSCHPDVVFMDYNLDEADGIEIVKDMQEQGVVAKFILLTGYREDGKVHDAMQAGFYEVVEKPISLEKVESIINGA